MFLPPRSTSVWCLADCDSFFAACEVARHPERQGKPVCVCRDGDIVIAATYEAKRQGIKTGTPSREIKNMFAGEVITCAPDFHWYQHCSKKVFACLETFALSSIHYSIDELFLELPNFGESDELSYALYAAHMQQEVYRQTGIPVSFGVAPTKLLAKIFSGLHKPKGVCVALEEHTINILLSGIPLIKTPFIGERFATYFPSCTTILNFKQQSGSDIKKQGKGAGLKLRLELNGRHACRFKRTGHQKLIGRQRAFHPHFTSEKDLLWSYLVENFEKAWRQLREQSLKLKYIKVTLKDKFFTRYSTKKRLPQATQNKSQVLAHTRELFNQSYHADTLYRSTCISFSELVEEPHTQYELTNPKQEQQEKNNNLIFTTIEQLNHKAGKNIITLAVNNLHTKKQQKKEIHTLVI